MQIILILCRQSCHAVSNLKAQTSDDNVWPQPLRPKCKSLVWHMAMDGATSPTQMPNPLCPTTRCVGKIYLLRLTASSGKRIASVRCPFVCLFHLFPNLNRARGAYSTWLTRGHHKPRPAYISVGVLRGRTYLFHYRNVTANTKRFSD